ncbi:MAG: hypothetical protein U0871_09125 [Gemmataceae bacterium]
MTPGHVRWYHPTVFFVGLLLLLLAGGRSSFFRDPGTFWHVRTGELILDTGRFLDHDPYTFTFGGRPWTPYEWLAEVVMAGVHRAAGIDGLLLLSATVLSGTFTVLFVRLCRSGLHWALVGCLTGLAVAASSAHFHARPHVLTIALLALTVLTLTDIDAGRRSVARLWWLVPAFVVWTNWHGGVLGGLGTVGLVGVGWLAFRFIGWPSPLHSGREVRELLAVSIALGLTVFATPYGLSLPRTWLEIMGMSELPSLIKEHARVDPTEPSSWAFFALGAVYLVALAGLRTRPRVAWLLPLVWLALGCERVRHAPLFAVAAVVAVADFFPHTRWAARLANRPDLYQHPAEGIWPAGRLWLPSGALIAALVLGCLGLQADGVRVPVVGAGWAEFPRADWPLDLIPHIKRETAGRTGGVPVFNEYEFGGFLIYFAPECRPFVDDRCEVFGGRWLAEFAAAGRPGADTAAAMGRWQAEYGRFDLALTHPQSGFDDYFRTHPGWEAVATDSAGVLYRRR